MGKKWRLNTFLFILPFLASCKGPQSMFEAVGPESKAIAELWWILLGVSLFVCVAVFGFLIAAMIKRTPKRSRDEMDQLLGKSLGWATGVTVVILVTSLIATYEYSKPQVERGEPDLIIEVTGRMWWWDIRYLDSSGNSLFTTANEITIPIHKNILFKLRSEDVIHSFWVPSLGGKIDMIPGHENQLWLQADQKGEYRGQCAEFCGVQHAKMSLIVFAVAQAEFENWARAQRLPAQAMTAPLAQRGKIVFGEKGCVRCHSIRPDYQAKELGPDLTHLASRKTLAAASMPNNKGHLAGWIADPQAIKPGNFMPATALTPEDFKALLSFLRSLK